MTLSPLSGLIRLITSRCNNFLVSNSSRDSCLRFIVDGHFVGLIQPKYVRHLVAFTDVFEIRSDPITGENFVQLNDELKDFESRTQAVGIVMETLRQTTDLPALKGWRNEDFGVYIQDRAAALLKLERAASNMLGITRYGVHINGYTLIENPLTNSNDIYMWIAVRSMTKQTFPGQMDNMVAGGLTYGLSVTECAHKECQEEASVPNNLLKNLKPVGNVSCVNEDERGISPQVEFIFDLLLPAEFKPINIDGEVGSFELVEINKVRELIESEKFKANSALVILDFLYRHGVINPDENVSEYLNFHSWLRNKLPYD